MRNVRVKPLAFRKISAVSRRCHWWLALAVGAFGLVALCFVPGTGNAQDTRVIYQVSSREAMAIGRFDGGPKISTLKKHGNFGLGTFDGLDGELIVIDGKAYQARVDGPPTLADDAARTPFALVTFFKPTQTITVHTTTNLQVLEQLILASMPSKKIYSAVRLTGRFTSIKARSVPKQTAPYTTLAKAVEQQHVFTLRDVDATLVGFWSPPAMAEMSGGGLHLHFLSTDGKHGGHVLDCEFNPLKVELEPIRHIEIVLVDH
jgi:acetolactate decarboxylase